MPLDRFNTQVLLLHSERGALDNLSAGFSERYTVHCATSGTEALNTLGDTPIHVIVSAQELPGMSGVEALREAKKRSPETIGILLAGIEDDVEALVGDEEVFQIVRGGISPEELGKLIDNATQQMRLMALAQSANDNSARVDEPTSEHIVMETADNGSTIISDGTGRIPALDPTRIPASIAIGARTIDVVALTTDDEFLGTVKDSARGLHNIHHASTLKQAEDALKKSKVGVAVIDAAMVGANIEKLAQHLRASQKRLVTIVAGRRDDGEMLMDLINRGKVYRFLMKPVSLGRARLAIEASVKHHLEAPDSAFKAASKSKWTPKFVSLALGKSKPTPDPAEAAAKLQAIAEAEKKAEELAKKNAAAQAAKEKSNAEAAKQKAKAETEKKKADAKAAKLKSEAQARKKAEAEAETGKKAKAEAEVRKKAEELARKKADADAAARSKAEAEERRKSEAEAQRKAEALAKQEAEAAAAAKKKADELARKKADEYARKQAEALLKKKAAADAKAKAKAIARQKAEEKASKKAEAAAKKKADAAAKKQAKAETRQQTKAAAAIRPSAGQDRLSGAFSDDGDGWMSRIAAIAGAIGWLPKAIGRVVVGAIRLFSRDDAPRRKAPTRTRYESSLNYRKIAVVGTAVMVAAAAGFYWVSGDVEKLLGDWGLGSDSDPAIAASTGRSVAAGKSFDELVELARDARDAGDIYSPPIANAIEQYLAAAAVAPPDASVAEELAATIEDALGLVEKALLAQRGDEAAAGLATIALADPDHQRLPFLNAQLAEVQLRNYMDVARNSIRESRFEDAATALARAGSIDGADKAEIKVLTDELRSARSAQRVGGNVALARERFEEGMLVAPPNDNARYYFELVLDSDRGNVAARQGLTAIAHKLILQARAQIDRGNFDAAEKLLSDVRDLDPSSAELAASTSALIKARESAPSSSRASRVEHLGIPGTTSQTQRRAPVRRPEPVTPKPVPEPIVTTEPVRERQAADDGSGVTANAASNQQASPPPVTDRPVAVSSLVRTKYVAPKYPRSAQRRELSGWVDVVFTVSIDGTVTNVDAVDSTPGDTFVDAAIRAVEKWEFEPVFDAGVAIEKRAAVRMIFATE